MTKKILSVTVSALLAVFALFPAAASATGSSTASSSSNVIWSGLWEGANLSFGSGSARPASSSAAAAVPATAGAYVALGDSVAAGLGLPTKSTVPSAETRCGRTAEAYPNTVARTMGLPLVHAACSGATAGDLVTKQRPGGPNLPPQLTTAFAGGQPSLITITAGANDARWVQFLRLCYSSANCANGSARPTAECIPDDPNERRASTTTLVANCYLRIMQIKLSFALASIRARSSSQPPTVVVTGYYNPVSPACTALTRNVTADEISWLTAEANALNQTIQGVAAGYSFARFAPVDFTGHDICSSQPWIQGLAGRAPFHPTAEGQQVIARSVLAALGR